MVRFSHGTALKQVDRHADLDTSYYAFVQCIIDEGKWFPDGTYHIVGYMTLNGKMYRTVLKRDALGQRLYLVTLHRDGDERLNRKRKSVREVK